MRGISFFHTPPFALFKPFYVFRLAQNNGFDSFEGFCFTEKSGVFGELIFRRTARING